MNVYHATKSDSARKILAEGFKPGASSGGVFVTWLADLEGLWDADTTIRLEIPDKLCADYQPPNHAPGR